MFDQHLTYETRFQRPTLAFVNSATVDVKSWIICHRISEFLQISFGDSYAATLKKQRLFYQSKESLQGTLI